MPIMMAAAGSVATGTISARPIFCRYPNVLMLRLLLIASKIIAIQIAGAVRQLPLRDPGRQLAFTAVANGAACSSTL